MTWLVVYLVVLVGVGFGAYWIGFAEGQKDEQREAHRHRLRIEAYRRVSELSD